MKITVAITGASGAIYAERLVARLVANALVEKIYVVFSGSGRVVFEMERGAWNIVNEKISLFANDDFFVPIASGSAAATAMVIVPCSMGTLSRVASGASSCLIERAADVQLKERRRLIVVPRETPLSLIHMRSMVALAEAGAVVLPAMPSFYSGADTVEQLADSVVERILDQIGLENEQNYRWTQK